MNRFRILSLDGGGIKGAFTASVAATLEEDTGKSLADYFDLITGTSTGGIIALGLGLGLPAREVVAFYQKHGSTIFPCTSLVSRWTALFRWLAGPKHSHEVLKAVLKNVLGDRKLGESKCRLVIPTYDANAGRIFLLKTAHHKRFKHDYQARMVDVALATAAAPTYFSASPFPAHQGASYVDGGVWANCPALVGITEAVGFLNVPLDQIDLLSIGTTAEPFSIAQHKSSGVLKWNAGLINLMFEAQVQAHIAQAKVLISGRLHRINHTGPAGQFSLDNATPEKIEELVSLGRGEAVKKENIDVVQRMFLNETAETFVPCYFV
jgi:patatin-like phospholipase/acyl hydrolase